MNFNKLRIRAKRTAVTESHTHTHTHTHTHYQKSGANFIKIFTMFEVLNVSEASLTNQQIHYQNNTLLQN